VKRYGAQIAVNTSAFCTAGTILGLYEKGTPEWVDFRPPNWGEQRWLYVEIELTDSDAEKARKRMLKINLNSPEITALAERQQIDIIVNQHHLAFKASVFSHVAGLSTEDQMIYAIGEKVHPEKLAALSLTKINAIDTAIARGIISIKNDTEDKIAAKEELNLVEKLCAVSLLGFTDDGKIIRREVYNELREKVEVTALHFREMYETFGDGAKVDVAQVSQVPDVNHVFTADSLTATPEKQWAKYVDPDALEDPKSGTVIGILFFLLAFLVGMFINDTAAINTIAPAFVNTFTASSPLDEGHPKYACGLNAFDPLYQVGDTYLYATIQAAVNALLIATGGNLAAGGVQNIEVYAKVATGNTYGGVDANTGFFGPGIGDYIHIDGKVAHGGLPGVGVQINTIGLDAGATSYAVIMEQWSRFSNIEIRDINSAGDTMVGIEITTGNGFIYNCIIHDLVSTGAGLSAQGVTGRLTMMIYNNLVFNITNVAAGALGIGIGYQDGSVCYNNTAYNITGTAGGWSIWSRHNSTATINNVSMDSSSHDFRWNGGESAANTDYNCSSDGTANDQGATHAQINKVAANQFVNIGAENFNLLATADCVDAGTDLSPMVIDDIVGTSRPQGSAYDIGAFELIVISGPTALIKQASRLGLQTGLKHSNWLGLG
jgi:hypothetical protein